MSFQTGYTAYLRWAVRLPGYCLLRLVARPGSPAEVRFHLRRRLLSLARVAGVTIEKADELVTEAKHSERLVKVEEQVGTLPYSGVFRGGPELYALIRARKPKAVVETGVGIGYSSAYILEALYQNGEGKLTSIDRPNTDLGWRLPSGRGPGFLVDERVRDRWNLIIGPTVEALPAALRSLGSIDIFFHDSEHTYRTMMFEFEQAGQWLGEGGLIVCDDAMWNTALLDFVRRRVLEIDLVYHRGGSAPFTVVRNGSGGRTSMGAL